MYYGTGFIFGSPTNTKKQRKPGRNRRKCFFSRPDLRQRVLPQSLDPVLSQRDSIKEEMIFVQIITSSIIGGTASRINVGIGRNKLYETGQTTASFFLIEMS
jgi:hypothetical protein